MKILISCGGTAGHINPAIAVADEIRHGREKADILFICRGSELEKRLIGKSGYAFIAVNILPLSRSFSLSGFSALLSIPRSVTAAGKIIDDYRPDAVFATGGYVCYPAVKAAQKRRIPTVLHESNATPGLAVRLLGRRADAVLCGMPPRTEEYPRGISTIFCGTPVRSGFFTCTRTESRRSLGIPDNAFFILSFGGSLGAEVINGAICPLMHTLSKRNENIYWQHGAGTRYFADIKKQYPELCGASGRLRISDYINDMEYAMNAADIVICRSGALTLAEAAASGAVPIMIPSPNVTEDHQTKNARLLADAGAGILVPENRCTGDTLLALINELRPPDSRLSEMKKKLKSIAVTDAANRAAKIVLEYAHKHSASN